MITVHRPAVERFAALYGEGEVRAMVRKGQIEIVEQRVGNEDEGKRF